MINGTEVTPDRATLAAFIGAMFRHADEDTFISLRAFEDGRREQPPLFVDGVKVGRPELIDWTMNRAKQAARHEKTANFCPPVATFSDQKKAAEADIANGVGLSVECDENPTQALQTLSGLLGETTVVCASGGEWTNPATGEVEPKLHLHWRLTEPTRTAEDHARLKRARKLACTLVGADATGVPINHPFRWPGSVHRKGQPKLARIIAQSENEIELADALDKLEAACPEPEEPTAKAKAFHDFASGAEQDALTADLIDIAAALAAIPNPDVKWKDWNDIGLAAWRASNGQAFAAFDAWAHKSAKYDAAVTAERWEHFGKYPPSRIGAGTLFKLAAEAIPGWRRPTLIARDAQRANARTGAGQERFDDGFGPSAERAASSAPSSDWPEPKPLPSGLLPVAPFDPDTVPLCIGPWVSDISERMQCPPDFVAISAMVGLASVLGRKVAVRPQLKTDWTEVANLWGCIVGRPGAMKSPAMSEALKPLMRLEAEARKQNEADAKAYAKAVEAHKLRKDQAQKGARKALADGLGDISGYLDIPEIEEPKPKRYVSNDATYEALGVILANNPNGVLAYRDELISLLKTLDREEGAAARGFFLTAWNGKDGYTFDRIIRGITHIDAACVSLLGSTQPGRIAEYLGRAVKGAAGDDGLIQRFGLLVWPDDTSDWKEIDRYPETEPRQRAWDAFTRLDRLTAESVGAVQEEFDRIPYLRLDDGARGVFGEWRQTLEKTKLRGEGMHASLESHLAKYRKLVPGLALLNHLADGDVGSVSELAMMRALSLAEYLESHARRAYGSGLQVEAGTAKAILAHIRKGDLQGEFTTRDVIQKGWSNLSDKGQVETGLMLLDDLDWIASRKRDTGGRPKVVHCINPRGLT